MERKYALIDKLCLGFDQILRSLTDNVKTTNRQDPTQGIDEEILTDEERKRAAALMRINHAGEICAQALYHGQGLVSRNKETETKMQQAALEEGDHLFWCKKRLDELNSHTSYLNPLWYVGSFCIGMAAGIVGDKWSLGFVAETENQVIKHLDSHLKLLPARDKRSHAILKQMEVDEDKHRHEALSAGAKDLPDVVKFAMKITSKVMVKTAYWV